MAEQQTQQQTQQTQQTQQQTQQAQPAWHGLPETDTEGLAYVANKGWKAPADIIKSYQGAEKLIGRDPSTLIPLPRADDPAGFRAVMSKLGLPEKPEGYEFAKPADGTKLDEGYQTWARSTFHELGLPAQTVKALTAKHNEYIAGVLAQQEKDYNLAVESDKKALLNEWRDGHERMLNAAQMAAKALGFKPEMIDAIERSVGYANTYKFFAELGKKMGEGSFVTGDGKPSFNGQMTPADAKAEWDKMKLNATEMAALNDRSHPGFKAATDKKRNLFAIMYPEAK